MIRSIIFDLDGTLVDSSVICAKILSDMLRDRGSMHTVIAEEAIPFLSMGGTTMVSGLLREQCDDPTADIAEFRARYAEYTTPKSSLYPGVEEGLRKLHSLGLKLAICSNKPQSLCDNVLRDVGLTPYFSVVLGGGPGRPPKPHPYLLERTLEQLGSTPSECFFVGDSELDQMIAASVGMPFLFLNHGYAEAGWDRSLLVQFDQFADLVAHISTAPRTYRARRRAA